MKGFNMDITNSSDNDLLNEINRRFKEKEESLAEMEFLTKKLLKLNEQAQEAEAVKSQFLSLIKNEFNNPLSVLLDFAKNLQEKRFPDRVDEMTIMMRSELQRMDFMLKNIFATTEIEAGEIANDFTKIAVIDLLQEIIDSLHYVISDKELTIDIQIPDDFHFICDRQKLFLILLNLLSNACEFSYPQKHPNIVMRVEAENIVILVEDFGEGIKTDSHKKVYNRFAQFHKGETRAVSGLGLGLSVVREYVSTLNGEIAFKSESGHTTFSVTVPNIDESDIEGGVGMDDLFFDDFGDDDMIDM
jgi:signal transduction histidine kinase